MGVAKIKMKGGFKNVDGFFKKHKRLRLAQTLDVLAAEGTAALVKATPQDTGLTAESWNHRVSVTSKGVSISWYNTNVVGGTPLVILLQYGHGTGTGGYVQGRDFINPAIKPVFDSINNKVWKEVIAT